VIGFICRVYTVIPGMGLCDISMPRVTVRTLHKNNNIKFTEKACRRIIVSIYLCYLFMKRPSKKSLTKPNKILIKMGQIFTKDPNQDINNQDPKQNTNKKFFTNTRNPHSENHWLYNGDPIYNENFIKDFPAYWKYVYIRCYKQILTDSDTDQYINKFIKTLAYSYNKTEDMDAFLLKVKEETNDIDAKKPPEYVMRDYRERYDHLGNGIHTSKLYGPSIDEYILQNEDLQKNLKFYNEFTYSFGYMVYDDSKFMKNSIPSLIDGGYNAYNYVKRRPLQEPY
jgi:hypothetical protein